MDRAGGSVHSRVTNREGKRGRGGTVFTLADSNKSHKFRRSVFGSVPGQRIDPTTCYFPGNPLIVAAFSTPKEQRICVGLDGKLRYL